MTTMNLRTRSYGSKALKGEKQPEKLPEFTGTTSGNTGTNPEIIELLHKIQTETSFDFQIRHLRQFIKLISNEKDKSNCDNIRRVVFWFFELNQLSSLRPAIASSLNKLTQDDHFVEAFDEAIKKMIVENDVNLPNKISRLV